MTMTAEQLKDILDKHAKWRRGEAGGSRANLAGAYLADANLADANLAGAYLAGANLAGAYLAGANLARIWGKTEEQARKEAGESAAPSKPWKRMTDPTRMPGGRPCVDCGAVIFGAAAADPEPFRCARCLGAAEAPADVPPPLGLAHDCAADHAPGIWCVHGAACMDCLPDRCVEAMVETNVGGDLCVEEGCLRPARRDRATCGIVHVEKAADE